MDYKIFEDKFIYHFRKYDIEYTDKIIKNFFLLFERISAENQKYNLTSITETDEVILKHFVDSVAVLKYFNIPVGAKIIDVGTGAGFPALPIYIMRNDLNITFLDSSAKKINFVRDTVELLDSDAEDNRLSFICGRAEDISRDKNYRCKYDFAVSRAVAKLNVLCELTALLIRTGGYFISYKGKNAENEIAEASNAIKILGLEIAEIKKFNIAHTTSGEDISEENHRVLIKIKKMRSTDYVYPRTYAKIIKSPL